MSTHPNMAQGTSPEPSPRRALPLSSPALLAAAIYTGVSLAAGLIFFLVTLAGDYSWVARIGGAIWVFALCMIILMPTITPWIRERMNR